MLIRIGEFDITECWDGVFYKKLSQYPEITAWEIQTVLDFIRYEKDNGRTCTIEADRKIINAIDRYRQTYDQGIHVSPPEKIEECTACPKYRGCIVMSKIPFVLLPADPVMLSMMTTTSARQRKASSRVPNV